MNKDLCLIRNKRPKQVNSGCTLTTSEEQLASQCQGARQTTRANDVVCCTHARPLTDRCLPIYQRTDRHQSQIVQYAAEIAPQIR